MQTHELGSKVTDVLEQVYAMHDFRVASKEGRARLHAVGAYHDNELMSTESGMLDLWMESQKQHTLSICCSGSI